MILERAFEKARSRFARVVMPEAEDPRIIAAAKRIQAAGLAEVVWLPDSPPTAQEIDAILSARPKATEGTARRMLERPLYRAGAMVASGQADAMLAGAANATRRVIEAAAITIGPSEPDAIPSSFFLMALPNGTAFVFADCGLNVAPDTAELAQIALASARSAQALFGTAKVAMLSFSTLDSGAGESVVRVREATEIVRNAGIDVVGPVQADAALNPAIAQKKGLEGGDANTLIFPSLDAGNIAYKLIQELAGAQALGPILQGFRRPVCDLSRGTTVDDIVAALAVTLALDT